MFHVEHARHELPCASKFCARAPRTASRNDSFIGCIWRKCFLAMGFAGFVNSFNDTPPGVERNKSISAGKKQPILLSAESVFVLETTLTFGSESGAFFRTQPTLHFRAGRAKINSTSREDSLHKKTEHPHRCNECGQGGYPVAISRFAAFAARILEEGSYVDA